MLRKCIAIILGIAFLDASSKVRGQIPSGQADPAAAERKMQQVKANLLKFKPGTKVIVSFVDGRWMQGKLGEISGEGFRLETTKSGRQISEQVALKDVESVVKFSHPSFFAQRKWALVGAAVAMGGLLLILWALGAGNT